MGWVGVTRARYIHGVSFFLASLIVGIPYGLDRNGLEWIGLSSGRVHGGAGVSCLSYFFFQLGFFKKSERSVVYVLFSGEWETAASTCGLVA